MTATITQTDQAIALGQARTAAWDAVRAFNADEIPARDMFAAVDHLAGLAEQYRAAFHPEAIEVFAVCDSTIGQELAIYARQRSRTGKTKTVQVWPS